MVTYEYVEKDGIQQTAARAACPCHKFTHYSLSGEHVSPPTLPLLVKNNNQRTTNKITVVIPALLSGAQRKVSLRPPDRLIIHYS